MTDKTADDKTGQGEKEIKQYDPSLDEIQYRWNPEIVTVITALPAHIVDSELKFASGDQVKVLLWLCRHIGEVFSSSVCAADTGVKKATCIGALEYWISRGIILPPMDVMPATLPFSASEKDGGFEHAGVFPAHTAKRIRASKPTTKDVIERQKTSEEFAFLLIESSSRLGKPLNHGDMETLLYLFETVGQPAAVILLIIAYSVSQNKGNMRYIEKVAIDWADKDICTVQSAEERLCEMERRTSSWKTVCDILGINKRATASEMNASERWIYEWKFEPDVIKVAYEVCMAKIEKFRSSYIDKVLSGWHLDGVDTMEKALEQLDPKKKSSTINAGGKSSAKGKSKEISFDFDEYDDMVTNFVPVYKKNGDGNQ